MPSLILSNERELHSYKDIPNSSDVLHPVGRDRIRCLKRYMRRLTFGVADDADDE
jgi:hypothetical protein